MFGDLLKISDAGLTMFSSSLNGIDHAEYGDTISGTFLNNPRRSANHTSTHLNHLKASVNISKQNNELFNLLHIVPVVFMSLTFF